MSTARASSTLARRWRRTLRVGAILVGAGSVLITAAVASASPTAPPPVTVLSPHGASAAATSSSLLPGARAPTPTALRSSTAAATSCGSMLSRGPEAADFRVQRYRGQSGPHLVAGHRARWAGQGTDYIYNDHYQPIAAVTAGNGLTADGHEFLITPWNTALILCLHHGHRGPDLDRRPGQPDGDRRRRPGGRHPDRQGPVPVEQRRPRSLQ